MNRGQYDINSPGRLEHIRKIKTGEKNPPAAKLTAEKVLSIRERLSNGERSVDLAKEFGLHPEHIGQIKRRKVWKTV